MQLSQNLCHVFKMRNLTWPQSKIGPVYANRSVIHQMTMSQYLRNHDIIISFVCEQ